jgi:hypothetical protein
MFLSARLEINVQKWGTVRERQRDVKPADLLRARASLIRKLSGSGMAAAHAPRGVPCRRKSCMAEEEGAEGEEEGERTTTATLSH